MNFIKLGLFATFTLIMGCVYASVSNMEGAGQCVGMMSTGGVYKISGKDWSPNSKAIFSKYYPTLQKLAPIVDGCTQGSSDINKFKLCVGKLPNQTDRDFVLGFNDGMNAAQKSFSDGGPNLLKTTVELTCSGIK